MRKILIVLAIAFMLVLTSCGSIQIKTFDNDFTVVESGISWKKYIDESTGCYYLGYRDKGISGYYKDGKIDCSDADRRIEINKVFVTEDDKFYSYKGNFEIINVADATLIANKIDSKDAKAIKEFVTQKIHDKFDEQRKEIAKYDQKQLRSTSVIENFVVKVKKSLIEEKIEIN